MGRVLYGNLDLAGNQLLNVVLQVLGADPTPKSEGHFYYNATADEIRYYDGVKWVAVNKPVGTAGGDLTGNYPDPQIKPGAITDSHVAANAAIAITKIAGLDTLLLGKVPSTRRLVSGAGLTASPAGDDLSVDRTFDVGAGLGITVDPDAVKINRSTTDLWYADRTATENAIDGMGQHVDALLGDLRYCGTYNALTHRINSVSVVGQTFPQYALGQPLPDAEPWNAKHYFLVVVGGPTSPTDGIYEPADAVATSYNLGDWILSNGAGVTVQQRDGTLVEIEPMITLPEAQDRWLHLSYSSRSLLATSIVMDPYLNGVPGQTVQQAITNLWDNTPNKLRQIIAGSGLTGGGDLTADRTLNVGAGTGIVVSADTVSIDSAWVASTVPVKGTVAPPAVGNAGVLGVSAKFALEDHTHAGVALTGNQTIAGIKTFSSPPVVPTPVAATDAANKQYVDLLGQGLHFKNAVRVVSTANITLSAPQSIDGVAVVAGDRVLVAGQTTATQNGVYVVAAAAWTRSLDADATGEIVDGTVIPVASGTANQDSLWLCTATSATPWVPGSSGSTWTKFSSISDLIAGNGLLKTGTTLSVKPADATIGVAAAGVSVVSAPKWTTPRTITLGGDMSGNVSLDGSGNVVLTATLNGGAGGKRYAAALTASASQVVTHNLNTRDVQVSVYNSVSPYEEVWVEVERTTVDSLTIKANPSLPAGYRVVITA